MDTDTDLRRHDLLIDGKRLPPGTGEYSVDINPATEEPIAHVAQGSAADVDTAVIAARAALKVWNGIKAAERGRILGRLAGLMRV
ncbi:aldehyde dehydrogenase family protein, partial [Paraburkholderia sp. SIMBA_054]